MESEEMKREGEEYLAAFGFLLQQRFLGSR
jgi:hypothetical protein